MIASLTLSSWARHVLSGSTLSRNLLFNEELVAIQKALERWRHMKGEPTDDEEIVLAAVTTQRQSVERLLRDLPAGQRDVERLFERLKGLYRKGQVEIEVRRRE